MKPGFIKIYRTLFDNFLWEEKREFSKAEAWIDLLRRARYEEGASKKMVGGKLIKWDRGQLPASIRFLKDAWGWGSNTKVENFLAILEREGMIKTQKGQGQNVITICNYDTYNDLGSEKKTGKGRGEDAEKTRKGQNSKKVKKVNKKPIPARIREAETTGALSQVWFSYLREKNLHPSLSQQEMIQHQMAGWGLARSKRLVSVSIQNGWKSLSEEYLPETEEQDNTRWYRRDAIFIDDNVPERDENGKIIIPDKTNGRLN